ncbi:MAG: cytochrome c [Saprospiraceae bacterium]|nr:cytochrome c [Saprospiraceae bacterium]
MNALKYLFFFFFFCYLASCKDNPYQQGHRLYDYYCANCHMEDGTGLKGIMPPLAGADYVEEDPLRMACIIRYGMEGRIEVNGITYDEPMAGIRELSDFEITNIINYINHAWDNDYGFVRIDEVRERLDECVGN